MRGGRLVIGALAAAACIAELLTGASGSRAAQYRAEQQLSTGNILVANEKLGDPNFAESVVLIVQYEPDEGTEGLVINRRTEITVSRIFPKTKHATKDPVYLGGPVGVTAVQALLRLPDAIEHATHVMGDVYVTGTKDLMETSIVSQADPSKFRVYLGYAGWGSGQLEAEIQLGAWSVINGSAKIIFDKDPDSLWSRLTRESHMQIASARVTRIGQSLKR